MEKEADRSALVTLHVVVDQDEAVQPEEMAVVLAEVPSHRARAVCRDIPEPVVVRRVQQPPGKMGVVLVVVAEILSLPVEEQDIVRPGVHVVGVVDVEGIVRLPLII